MKLRHPDLPCLCFGAQGKNAVPMELCEFAGGEPRGHRLAAGPRRRDQAHVGAGAERLQKVQGFAREVKAEASASGSTASAFGIAVGDPMVVMGRELPMMGLEYKGGVARPKQHDGSWFADAGGRKFNFHRASQVDRVFVVLCAEGQDAARFLPWQALQTWQKTIETEARTRGVRFPQFPEQPIVHTGGKIETTLNRELGPMSLTERDLVCCILPDKKDRREHDIYESIKRWMHATGVPTQCTQAPKALRVGKGYDSNMLHKMNLKMGGANWRADRGGLGLLRDTTGIGSPGTIVFGCDVRPPRARLGPSVVRGARCVDGHVRLRRAPHARAEAADADGGRHPAAGDGRGACAAGATRTARRRGASSFTATASPTRSSRWCTTTRWRRSSVRARPSA